MNKLREELLTILGTGIGNKETRRLFFKRLAMGSFTRDENPNSHVSTFLGAHRKGPGGTEILIGWHKKADRYLVNGGHLDFLKTENRAETCWETALREASEELEIDQKRARALIKKPFWITHTPIYKSEVPCQEHFDVWFDIDVTGIDVLFCSEFDHMFWCTIDVAIGLCIDEGVVEGLHQLKIKLK